MVLLSFIPQRSVPDRHDCHPTLVVDRTHNGLRAQGYTRVELSWVLEDNDGMRALAEATSAEPYKTYRIYEKDL